LHKPAFTEVKNYSFIKEFLIESLLSVQVNYGFRGIDMRILLTTLLIALLAVPLLSQAVDVGGSFGASWISTSGNKGIIPNATGLWSWGQIPLGNIVQGGKLVSTGNSGDTVLVFPAFAEGQGSTALQSLMSAPNVAPGQLPGLSWGNYVDNRTLNVNQVGPRGLNGQQLSSPYLSEDPWTVAQESGQAVLTHSVY
jgi:hypothetical protein